MRKTLQSTLISIDGVVADPGSWAMQYFDEQSAQEALQQLYRSDAMLMGRITFQELAGRWSSESGPFADRLREIPKYVFSSTLVGPVWQNTTILNSDPVKEVERLKNEGDGDLTLYGFGRLGRSLLDAGLLDEIRFSMHPVIVGGKQPRLEAPSASLVLSDVQVRRSGVVVSTYSTRA